MSKGFTLIELSVVICVIAILSSIILFSVLQYVNRGKDSNIRGNLAVLIPAGEQYYDIGNTYTGFCTAVPGAITNAEPQMPGNPNGSCTRTIANPTGACCTVSGDGRAWAACARLFTNASTAYCVDSTGVKKVICRTQCSSSSPITACPASTCY